MLERLPVRRHVRRFAMLTLAVLALTAMPGLLNPVAAEDPLKDEDLVDLQAEYTQGTLQRLVVNTGTVPPAPGGALPFNDGDGMLQLTPIGGLDPSQWAPTIPLPQARAQMGVTTIGNRIFVIAGATGRTQGTPTGFANTAYWARLDPVGGGIVNHQLTAAPSGATLVNNTWVNDPLPPVSAYTNFGTERDAYPDCVDETIGPRAAPAVASFTAGNGRSYIYVIGGAFTLSNCGSDNLSSPAVQIGEFNPTTNDIAWTTGASQRANYIPNQDLPAFESWSSFGPTEDDVIYGIEQATASVVTVGSTTYLYVIGGLINYAGGATPSMATPAVFYTRLNATTGALENPVGAVGSPWARTANVPLNLLQADPNAAPPPGDLGIYSHTAIVSQAVVGAGTSRTVTPVIYVTGGYTDPALGAKSANATVFRAKIGAQGALTWDIDLYTPAPTNEVMSTEGKGRAGAAGFAFDNKLYVVGGIENSAAPDPLGTATIATHNDQLDLLPLFGTVNNRIYFIGTNEDPIITPAYGVGGAVIPATPVPGATPISAAYGYVVGGFNTNDAALTTIYRGRIAGASEASLENVKRVPEGWYYSPFYPIRINENDPNDREARIVSITWYATVDRANPGADMRIEFRRTRQLPCNEAAFGGAGTEWKVLDADASSSLYTKGGTTTNEVKLSTVEGLADPIASCLQFRVYMTQNGTTGGVPNTAANASLTPTLYRLAIQKIKPGEPDLYIESFTIGANSFDLKIKNLNNTLLNTSAYEGNQFPVVLCVDRRDLTADPNFAFTPPSLPILNDPDGRVNCAPLYRWTTRAETVPGQTFTLNSNWRVNFAGYYPGKPQDSLMNPVQSAFTTPGHYAVTAIIDPFNLVKEGGKGKANNRGENLNNNQPLVRRFTVREGDTGSKIYLPFTSN